MWTPCSRIDPSPTGMLPKWPMVTASQSLEDMTLLSRNTVKSNLGNEEGRDWIFIEKYILIPGAGV